MQANIADKLMSNITNAVKEGNQRRTYWEKMQLIKINRQKAKEAKAAATRNSQESQEDRLARMEELRLYEVGCASQVGQRKGEMAYEPVGAEKEAADDNRVSILQKNKVLSNDVHMKIIELHAEEKYQEQLEAEKNASCFQKFIRFITRAGGVYPNEHPIDNYIDKYWLLHCPEEYSVT